MSQLAVELNQPPVMDMELHFNVSTADLSQQQSSPFLSCPDEILLMIAKLVGDLGPIETIDACTSGYFNKTPGPVVDGPEKDLRTFRHICRTFDRIGSVAAVTLSNRVHSNTYSELVLDLNHLSFHYMQFIAGHTWLSKAVKRLTVRLRELDSSYIEEDQFEDVINDLGVFLDGQPNLAEWISTRDGFGDNAAVIWEQYMAVTGAQRIKIAQWRRDQCSILASAIQNLVGLRSVWFYHDSYTCGDRTNPDWDHHYDLFFAVSDAIEQVKIPVKEFIATGIEQKIAASGFGSKIFIFPPNTMSHLKQLSMEFLENDPPTSSGLQTWKVFFQSAKNIEQLFLSVGEPEHNDQETLLDLVIGSIQSRRLKSVTLQCSNTTTDALTTMLLSHARTLEGLDLHCIAEGTKPWAAFIHDLKDGLQLKECMITFVKKYSRDPWTGMEHIFANHGVEEGLYVDIGSYLTTR